MRLTKVYLPALCLLCLCLAGDAFAGGWPVRKGKFMLSFSGNYFKANRLWDENGKIQRYDNNGYYASRGLSFYGEYGISRRFTAVASVPFMWNEFSTGTNTINLSGFGDAELGIRYYLANVDFKYYMGLQASAILPLYSTETLGFATTGADLKYVISGSTKHGTKTGYFNVEVGGRYYFESGGPFQAKYSASYGYNFDEKNQVTAGVAGTHSMSTDKGFNQNLAINKDFWYTQGSLSYAHIFSPKFSFFAGVNQFLIGRSTGIGTNFSVSLITKL